MNLLSLSRGSKQQGRGELPYGKLVVQCMPRLLSALDRNPYSPTYGCFDRGYWHYRTLVDYAAPLHQEAALTLVIACKQKEEANPYYGMEELLHWANAALRFWCGLQRKDGSFDEFYPYERSFVATAFTSYAVSETLLLLADEVEEETRQQVVQALERAAVWLQSQRDVEVVNHTAGAIAALRNIEQLTGAARYAELRQKKIADLLEYQHEEGWFYEYGGADLGYLSMAVDYLAKDYRRSKDPQLRDSLHKALDFMVHFMHPDGSFGGEYGSRNVKYLMPHGLEIMADESSAARRLLAGLYATLPQDQVVSPALMDDRYTGFFLNKYAEAWTEQGPGVKSETDVVVEQGTRVFPGAGLLVHCDQRTYAVVGMSKHGVFKAYDRQGKGLVYSDTGYFANFANGAVGTTQWLDLAGEREIVEDDDSTQVKLACQMAKMNVSLPLVNWLIPFRLFLKIFGRSGKLMDRFAKVVKKKMITSRTLLPLHLERHICLGAEEWCIEDKLTLSAGSRLVRLGRCRDAAALHVASSRYYQPGERHGQGQWQASDSCLAALNKGQTVVVVTRVSLAEHRVEYALDYAGKKEDLAA